MQNANIIFYVEFYISEMGDIKQFLNTWCAKNKVSPNYEYGMTGAKHRPRFKCEVIKKKLFVQLCGIVEYDSVKFGH